MPVAGRAALPALQRLWQVCFGDSAETVAAFFDALWDVCTVFASERLDSMVIALPVRWQGREAAYLYAVCTDPASRGQGQCRRLMEEAEETLRRRGVSYAVLTPATAPLFSFYAKLGYRASFFCDSRAYPARQTALRAHDVPPARYAALREAQLPRGIHYPVSLLSYAAREARLLEIPGLGCAVVERRPEGFFAPELLASDPAAAASAVCAALALPRLPARLPGKRPFAMGKSLDGSPLRPAFLGLDFA